MPYRALLALGGDIRFHPQRYGPGGAIVAHGNAIEGVGTFNGTPIVGN